MSRLRLREVRLSGFKTFADKTTIAFTPGITAIVGPNGSGKSNIVDALRWSLGEAGRGIRSKRVDEVIFAGSEKRRPLGLAEVSLTIANDDGLFDLPFTEIEIARRADRGGGQEYLLNREKIRLRDLNELLDGAGLAENGLLFIGQGAVDQALSLRAEERRALVEEFAGTARHERRRARAEGEMHEAIENRARVEEILSTLRPQERRLATLARQEAGREELLSEAVERIVALGTQRAAWLAQRRTSTGGRLTAMSAELAQIRSSLRAADAEAQERRNRLVAARTTLEGARRELDVARETREAAARSHARVESESAAIIRDAERVEHEVGDAEREIQQVDALRAAPAPSVDAEAASTLELLDADLSAARREAAMLAGERAGDSDAGRSIIRAQRSRESERADAEARLERAVAELTAVDADESSEDQGVVTNAHAAASAAWRDATVQIERAVAAVTAAETSVASARATVSERQLSAHTLESELASQRGRMAALEARRTVREARALDRAAREIGGQRLLDGVQIREEGRLAIFAALGALVDAYVVDRRGASLLDDVQGALLIDGLVSVTVAAHPTLPSAAGELLVDPTGHLSRVLQGVSIAPSVAVAIDALSDLPPGGLIVTRSGALLRSGGLVIRAAEPDEALLTQQIEALATSLERDASVALTARRAADTAAQALDSASRALADAREQEQRARAALRVAETNRAAAARSLEAATRRHEERNVRASRLRESITALRARIEELSAGPDSAGGDARIEWQARIDDLSTRRAAVAAAVERDRQALRGWELERARGDARVAAATARIARAAEERGALEARRSAIQAELAGHAGRAAAAGTLFAEREATLQQRLAELGAVESEIATDDERKRTLRERESHLDEAVRPLERDAQGLEFEWERFIEELAGDLATFGRRLAEDPRIASGIPSALRRAPQSAEGAANEGGAGEGDVTNSEAVAREQAVALAASWGAQAGAAGSAPDPEGVRALERLRRKIGPLDATGASIALEHHELRARLESLETQTADLDGAIAKAAELMRELDGLVETTFAEQFTALQATFATNFQLLFGGGDAQLRLAEDGDSRRPGIEIDARPPLKRRQQLSLLSGGERALTGVALLLGMLAVRPLPFVVLDEVDAALDEANVARFGDAIRELSERTQVVVITHNRGTVEVADSLWGVTVGDDAASRVFGLRLDEAKKIADAARAEREAAR
jgi:chromosome segregation protein